MTSLALLIPILIVITHPDSSVAYSTPNVASLNPACTTLTPGHVALTPQTSLPPYAVTFTPTTFTPGVTSAVRVTIKTCEQLPFKGFLIQARRADTTADQAALGRFQTITNTQRTCSLNSQLTSLSHSTSDAKTSLSFDWYPSNDATLGHVVFRVTFVQSYNIVWADIKSQILVASTIAAPSGSNYVTPTPVQSTCSQAATQAPATQAPATQAPVTQAPPVTSVTSDSDCGSTKGCYDDCQSNSGCSFQVSWFEDGTNGVYKIVSSVDSTSTWIAVGFSDAPTMDNASVMGCASTDGVQVYGFNAFNTGYSPSMYADTGVALVSSSLTNNVLTCTFRRRKTEGSNGKRFDITLPWNLLFAKGGGPTITSQEVTALSYHQKRIPSTLQYRLGSVTGQAAAATTAPPALQGVTKDAACGSTKGCFTKCTGATCDFVVSWREDGNNAEFTLTSSSSDNSFLALGFSSDSKMGDDDVLGCAVENGVVKPFSAKNNGKSSAKREDIELELVSGTYVDNILRCTLRRPKTGTAVGGVSVVTPWTYLFARGSAEFSGGSPGPTYHGANGKFISSQALMISDTMDLGAASTDRKLVKLHGSLMVLAWVFMASLGVLMPRYFKSVWMTNIMDLKAWFLVHRTCMTLVMLLTIGGFVAIWLEVEEFSELQDKKHLEAHPIMGTVVMGLTLINPIMAVFRPHPGTANRKFFNFFHWLVGSGGYTLAIVTVYFGVLLEVADVPHFIFYVLIAYSSWQFVAEVSMGIASACCRTTGRKEQYELNDDKTDQTPATDKPISVETEQGLKFKKIMLALHIVCTLAFTSVIIAFIVIGEKELDS